MKIVAWSSMALSLAYTVLVHHASWPLVAAIVAVMGGGVWYVATKPSQMPADAENEDLLTIRGSETPPPSQPIA